MARFTSLLKQFGLTERLVINSHLDILQDIDYKRVNEVLRAKREEGVTFLKNSL